MTSREKAIALLAAYKRRRDHEVGEAQAFDELQDSIERALDAANADREHALAVARHHFIPPTHRQSVAEFESTYARLAAANVCPAYDDGARERLLGEWILVGRPEIEPFIRARVDRPGWLG